MILFNFYLIIIFFQIDPFRQTKDNFLLVPFFHQRLTNWGNEDWLWSISGLDGAHCALRQLQVDSGDIFYCTSLTSLATTILDYNYKNLYTYLLSGKIVLARISLHGSMSPNSYLDPYGDFRASLTPSRVAPGDTATINPNAQRPGIVTLDIARFLICLSSNSLYAWPSKWIASKID